MSKMIGFAASMFILLLVTTKLRRKTYRNCDYDERQELVRGEAYKMGLVTLVFGMAVNAMWKETMGFEWATPVAEMAVLLGVSLFVLTGICIFKDAYFSPTVKDARVVLISLLIGMVNLGIGIFRFLHQENFDELHRFSNINLILGLILTVIPLMAFLHKLAEKSEEQ